MTTKHTPGPWSVRSQKPYYDDPTAREWIMGSDGVIAHVSRAYGPNAEANARLIAAAPALLAALKATVTRITDDYECLDCGSQRPDGRGGTDHDQDCIVHLLEDAIAAAEKGA